MRRHFIHLFALFTSLQACGIDRHSALCTSLDDLSKLPDNITILTFTGNISHLSAGNFPPDLTHLGLANCALESIEPFVLDTLQELTYVNLSSNELREVRWQSLALSETHQVTVDLRRNPLDCQSCANAWMLAPDTKEGDWSVKSVFAMPGIILLDDEFRLCSFEHCPHSRLEPSLQSLNLTKGDEVRMSVEVHPPQEVWLQSAGKYFRWLHEFGMDAEGNETISNTTLALHIQALEDVHLGMVFVRCWHCIDPTFAVVELRFEINMTVWMTKHEDWDLLTVRGYPLDHLQLTVETETLSEEHTLGLLLVSYFGDSLFVKPFEEKSVFFRRRFEVFSRTCSHCPTHHPVGNFSFTVCGNNSCGYTNNFIDHYPGKMLIPPERSRSRATLWPWLIAFCLFVVASALLSILFYKRKMPFKVKETWFLGRRTSRATEETSLRLEERSSLSSSDYSTQIVPLVPITSIHVLEKIGEGAFGEVYSATWSTHEGKKREDKRVAVKILRDADTSLEREAALLARLDHPNVMRLYGVAKDSDRFFLVFELMNLGDLRTYLRQRAPQYTSYSQFPPSLTARELLGICAEIIEGLCYLADQQVVHRDLAARNCLVAGESDHRVCLPQLRPQVTVKISDFGMSRRLYSHSEYYRIADGRGSVLPVRWLPPESLNTGKFNHQSDIWALGVTMWEVFSYGEVPFKDLSNHELVSYALSGIQPPKPEICPRSAYEVMELCWQLTPSERCNARQAKTMIAQAIADYERISAKKKADTMGNGNVNDESLVPLVVTA